MKALSIRQPWAWLILHGGKRVENRSWANCNYRGPLLIHAAKNMTYREHEEARFFAEDTFFVEVPAFEKLERGGIVGICDVIGTLKQIGDSEEFTSTLPAENTPDLRWFFGPLGIVLDNVRAVPFTPYKGELGLFDVPDDLAKRLIGGAQ